MSRTASATKKSRKSSSRATTRRRKRRGWRTASTSDRHELYELSVQNPEAEVDFIDRIFRKLRGHTPRLIREDFCGTAAASVAFVKRRRANRAIGVDLDASVLAWGRERLNERLDADQRSRLELRRANVLTVRTPPVEAVLAMNFSYYIFKERSKLLSYFRKVRAALAKGGLFLLDAYGGSDSFLEMEEERSMDGFTYVWDQHRYNPITGEAVNHIHFRFPDGTELKRAFTYDWRLWTLPEIRDLLTEAGFRRNTVYWEGAGEDGRGDGIFRPATRGDACEGWIAYIVAEP